MTLSRSSAAQILSNAAAHATDAGIGWKTEAIRLVPAPKLLELIRRSRKAAANEQPTQQ